MIDEHLHDWLVDNSEKEKRSLVKTITIALEKYRESKLGKRISINKKTKTKHANP